MHGSTDNHLKEPQQLDVIVAGVDDLDALADVEWNVRQAFAAAGVDGRWTVALRRRHALGGWVVGVIGRLGRGCVDIDMHLIVESDDSLRASMTTVFGSTPGTD